MPTPPPQLHTIICSTRGCDCSSLIGLFRFIGLSTQSVIPASTSIVFIDDELSQILVDRFRARSRRLDIRKETVRHVFTICIDHRDTSRQFSEWDGRVYCSTRAKSNTCLNNMPTNYKMLSYRRETALQGAL